MSPDQRPPLSICYLLYTDMPGIIGKIGSLLGSFNVIASMQVAKLYVVMR